MKKSDKETKVELLRQRQELMELQEKISSLLAEIDKKVGFDDTSDSSDQDRLQFSKFRFEEAKDDEFQKIKGVKRPVRALLLDTLEDLGWAAYSREVANYSKARYGRLITSERFGTLASDEIRTYKNGPHKRPVWLCFCLTHDRHEKIQRLWARSDWPLEKRIVAPTTLRIQHLKVTASLCEIAIKNKESIADPTMFGFLVADHARDIPGVRIRKNHFDFEVWQDLALNQVKELEPEDKNLRIESAKLISNRPEFYQLYGMPSVIEGDQFQQLSASN